MKGFASIEANGHAGELGSTGIRMGDTKFQVIPTGGGVGVFIVCLARWWGKLHRLETGVRGHGSREMQAWHSCSVGRRRRRERAGGPLSSQGTYKHQHVAHHPHLGFAGVLEGLCAAAAYNLRRPGARAAPGAITVCDWQTPGTSHTQHIASLSRATSKGRIP
jgi:hypothetical protein